MDGEREDDRGMAMNDGKGAGWLGCGYEDEGAAGKKNCKRLAAWVGGMDWAPLGSGMARPKQDPDSKT